MDLRWCYYTSARPLWNEPRPDYVEQMWAGNRALLTRRKGVASPEGPPSLVTSSIGYQHALNTDAYFFPLRLKTMPERTKNRKQRRLLAEGKHDEGRIKANLSQVARNYLQALGIGDPDADEASANMIWMHALSISYSPAYLLENADGMRQDWPRVPLPGSMELIKTSAALGSQVAALIDTESPAKGVTVGDIRPELKLLALPSRVGGGALKDDELAVTTGWGHTGKGGVTQPGQGRLTEREYLEKEREAISVGATSLGLTAEQAFAHLGPKTCDIYLNNVAYWSNIPAKVWDYTIGGYPVIKKWLAYREKKLLGRALAKDEVRYVQEMVRRIAAILLLEPTLDANYRAVKANTFPWAV